MLVNTPPNFWLTVGVPPAVSQGGGDKTAANHLVHVCMMILWQFYPPPLAHCRRHPDREPEVRGGIDQHK